MRRVVTAAYEDNIFFLASALTFQALLAALPFVLLALAALGFEMAKRMYVVYIVEFATLDQLLSNNNVIALVLLVLLIAWMYFTACLFLIGAEVAEAYDLGRRQREQQAILT